MPSSLAIAHRALEPLHRLHYLTILRSWHLHHPTTLLAISTTPNCNLAQELSLDNEIDSPFAILAKVAPSPNPTLTPNPNPEPNPDPDPDLTPTPTLTLTMTMTLTPTLTLTPTPTPTLTQS